MTRQCGLREAETEAVAACSVASRAADLRNGIVRSLPLQLQPQGVHDAEGQGQRGAARCREGARAAGDSDRLSKESPESGCAPQLGDNLGLQRGDAEFIEKFLVSALALSRGYAVLAACTAVSISRRMRQKKTLTTW